MNERRLLEAARAGDENAFARLVDPHRGVLHAHCYRMLGSVPDAEDTLQETLLSAWRGLPGFKGRSSLRSWLYAIATNACLRAIQRRPKRVLPVDYGPAADPHDGLGEPLVESVWIDAYPDEQFGIEDGLAGPEARYEQRESVELAFIAALQHLPARQRAVLILRDVLGFSAREAAEALETTPAGVDSALQRAHKAVDERLPERSQQAVLRSLDDARLRELVQGFVDAWERSDVDAVVAMLAADGTITMPPLPTWYRGREAMTAFLAGRPLRKGRRWRFVPIRANGQPALGCYSWDEERRTFTAHSIGVLTLDDAGRIADFTSFLDPELLPRFGLPSEVDSRLHSATPETSPAGSRGRGRLEVQSPTSSHP
jgi:RNA polymerase sigma-70 factor, ECF subfamily